MPAFDEFDEFDVSAVDHALRVLEDEIEDGLHDVFLTNTQRTAQTVKAIHPWQNRTGALEASTEGLRPTGRVMAGTLQGGVVMGAQYASHLEAQRQWACLDAAWQYVEPSFERDAQDTLDRAVLRAGLR